MKRIIVAALAVTALSLSCTGQQGPTGEQGPKGDPGVEGPAGTIGPVGSTGPAGQNGANGSNGTNGTNGVNGRSSFVTVAGIKMTFLAASISPTDGTATADFRITDPNGVPLDLNGLYTDGPVLVRLILAYMPVDANGKALQYVAYTTRTLVSPLNDAGVLMANTDTGGTFTELNVSQGTYRYTFAAKGDVTKAALVHTVAGTATRTMPLPDGQRYVANATFHFVPAGNPADAGVLDGGSLPPPREAVTIGACNQCHNVLKVHGGNRRDTAVCITCHTPQSTDPATLRTVDFKVMIHKLHMGAKLPSVLDGGTYGIQRADWSTVEFPQDIGNCVKCHTGGPDTNRWMTTPSREACTSCHDDVVFEVNPPPGKRLHSGGDLLPGEPCGPACHGGTTGLAPIATKHTTIRRSATRTTVELTINSVTSTAPGQTPVVNFTVKVNGAPRDITTAPLSGLSATIAGPSTDIASFWSATIQGLTPVGTLAAVDAANGIFAYTFPAAGAIPTTALGSYGVGLEGYLTDTATNQRLSAVNPVKWFAVTDTTAKARRTSVTTAKCETCHLELNGHGYTRKNTDYCVFCHNPNKTNSTRVAQVEGQTVVAHSVDFKDLIHNIHTGEAKVVKPYVYGAYPVPNAANPQGTPFDASEVRFPGDRRVCTTCHVSMAAVNLPLAAGALPSLEETLTCTEDPATDTNSFCQAPFFVSQARVPTRPETAACTSCHDDPVVATHAQLNTTATGQESCAVCHAIGEAVGIDKVHVPVP